MPPFEKDMNIIENNYCYFSKAYFPKIKVAFAFLRKDLENIKKIQDKNYNRNIWKQDGDLCLKDISFQLVFRK